MKNILYIGPYRQNDGWGEASKDYLRAIGYACTKLGYNLISRPIYLAQNIDKNIPEDIKIYETNKHFSKIDTVIQKALPQAICPTRSAKNIGLCVFEQRNLIHSSYIKQVFSKLNGIVVPSTIEKKELINAGLSDVYNISQPINTTEISSFIETSENDDLLGLNTKYKHYIKFYFIGSFINRKNIMNLLIAFNNTFQHNEKALLIIKTNSMTSEQREVMTKNITETLSIFKYRKHISDRIIIISDNMDRNTLLRLHSSCDSFVCASKGEAFCRPLAESIAFGNYPIAVDGTGAAELIDTSIGGAIIPSHIEYVEPNPSNKNLDHECELEYWCEPTLFDISNTLRKTFDILSNLNETEKTALKNHIKQTSSKLSIQSIGEQICSLDIM